jgi:hypothetical protein
LGLVGGGGSEVLQGVFFVAQQQVGKDREEGAEDGPGKQDGQAAGLCHCWDSRAGLSWSRRTEMSIRGRLNAVI